MYITMFTLHGKSTLLTCILWKRIKKIPQCIVIHWRYEISGGLVLTAVDMHWWNFLSDITGFYTYNHLVLFQNVNDLVPIQNCVHCSQCLPVAMTRTSQTQEYIRSANTSATLSTLVPINPWQTVVVVQLKSTYQSPDAVNQSHSTYRKAPFTEIPTVNQCKFWSRCCQCL